MGSRLRELSEAARTRRSRGAACGGACLGFPTGPLFVRRGGKSTAEACAFKASPASGLVLPASWWSGVVRPGAGAGSCRFVRDASLANGGALRCPVPVRGTWPAGSPNGSRAARFWAPTELMGFCCQIRGAPQCFYAGDGADGTWRCVGRAKPDLFGQTRVRQSNAANSVSL